jgi:hypothetical protein
MKSEDTIQTAWEISNLMARLNDLIWDQFEDEFIERYIKSEEQKYWEAQEDKP